MLPIPLNKSICTSRSSRKKADLLEHTLNHSKDIDLERAKEFHCELCQKDWKKWKFLADHICKYHSDIQGELKGFPLRTNGRYVSIVKFVVRKKLDKNDDPKFVCEECQQEWDSKKVIYYRELTTARVHGTKDLENNFWKMFYIKEFNLEPSIYIYLFILNKLY